VQWESHGFVHLILLGQEGDLLRSGDDSEIQIDGEARRVEEILRLSRKPQYGYLLRKDSKLALIPTAENIYEEKSFEKNP